MASMVKPPMPSRKGGLGSNNANAPTTMRAAAQRPPSGPSVPIRSARRVKKGVVSTGTDVEHVIRVTVLGLAGITVDRTKCRDYRKLTADQKEIYPPPPSKMRAVVAFARSSQIRGITSLSKPLSRSPNDDIVLTSSDDDTTGTGRASSKFQKSRADSDSFGSDHERAQRHVAVWTAENKSSLGSAVVFEANLHRKDKIGGGGRSSASSSAFAPKSFELTIALTEDGKRGCRVALPFGVTTLAIAGDECEGGKPVILDLPVLSLQQARPLASNKNGFSGYPMISISEKISPTEPTGDDDVLKKKRGGLKRFFSRKQETEEEKTTPKFPSVPERNAFSAAYSTDATGDAILRVSLEVCEKGSEQANQLEPRGDGGRTADTSWLYEQPVPSKRTASVRQSDPIGPEISTQIPLEVRTTKRSMESEAEVLKPGNGFKMINKTRNKQTAPTLTVKRKIDDESSRNEADHGDPVGFAQKSSKMKSTDSYTTESSTERSGSSSEPSERSSQDSSGSSTADSGDSDRRFHLERAAEGSKAQLLPFIPSSLLKMQSSQTEATDNYNDDYTLSFTKKESTTDPREAEEWEPPGQSIKIFGRKFDLPLCGSWPQLPVSKGDAKTVDGKSETVQNDSFTYATTEFFGRDLHLPLCSAVKRGDDETLSASTFTNRMTNNQSSGFVDKLCRSDQNETPDEDDESISWITNITDGTQSNKKLSLKDFVRLSLSSNGGPNSAKQLLNSVLSADETTLDGASYVEEVTVDEDGTATMEARDGPDERPASANGSSKRSDRIQDTTVHSHSPAVRKDTFSKRVADALAANVLPKQVPSDLRPTMSQHFAELFTCRTSSTTLDDIMQYEPFQSDVPPVIIHDDLENASLGDLTANTHEMRINAKRRQDSRQKNSTSIVPFPVAFGGDGLCMGANVNSTISNPIPFGNRERNSILSLNPSFENYFADYDDYSILSPEAKAQALARHTKIIPSNTTVAYKEEIVHIAPASPLSQARKKKGGYPTGGSLGIMRESELESTEFGQEVNENE